MLCLDCELAENGIGCSSGRAGVCGRSAEVAAFQNLLLDFTRKLARQMVERSCSSERLDRLIVKALTATAAGINFDEEELRRLCEEVASACGIHFPQNRFDQLEIAERSGIAGGRLRLGNELAARLALLFTGIRGSRSSTAGRFGWAVARISSFPTCGGRSPIRCIRTSNRGRCSSCCSTAGVPSARHWICSTGCRRRNSGIPHRFSCGAHRGKGREFW